MYCEIYLINDEVLTDLDTDTLHGSTHSVFSELLFHCRLHRIKIPFKHCSIFTKSQPWLAAMEIRLSRQWRLLLNL
jgi:hypothetical protein